MPPTELLRHHSDAMDAQVFAKALEFRMEVGLPREIDTLKSDIWVYYERTTRRCVTSVHQKGEIDMFAPYPKARIELVEHKWVEQFGTPILWEGMEGDWAWRCNAGAFLQLGVSTLSDDEVFVLKDVCSRFAFGLDMRWLAIEGLGWRPGKPVNEHDEGWIAIWAEDRGSGWLRQPVLNLLGMSTDDREELEWFPPALAEQCLRSSAFAVS